MAVGNWKTGPAPQINFPGFFGDMKNVGTMSPKPYSPVSGVPGALCSVAGIHAKIVIVLYRHADEAGDGILCCFL